MSKIIYRKVKAAPGVKQYLDDEKTQVNPAFESSMAYYAKAVSIETLSLRDMAKHISSHGSPYTVDVVLGVLEAYRNCLVEQLLEAKKIKLEGLGTFYLTIANKAGGEKDLKKFNISTITEGLRIRFLPDSSQEDNLSSKEFLKKANFVDVATLASQSEESESTSGTVIDDDDTSGGSGSGSGSSTGTNTGSGGNDNSDPNDNGELGGV